MKPVSPCKNCSLRHVSCHSDCPKDVTGIGYKKWKEMRDKETEEQKKSELIDKTMIDIEVKRAMRIKKGYNRK